MHVQVSARHCDPPESITLRTHDLVEKLERFNPHISRADVVFEVVRHVHSAEGILSIDRHEPVIASGEGDSFTEALDLMIERLSKILRRMKGYKVSRHREPTRLRDIPADADIS